MKISFLVTYYNQEAYVRQSMDSILAIDKPEEWEILIGDDGSTDATREIAGEYVQRDPEHIRMFVMPREAGKKYDSVLRASANRLNLLEHCSGDCFCVLDGDDFYCDRTFAKEAAEMLETHPDAALIAFGYREYRHDRPGEEKVLPAASGSRIAPGVYLRKGYYVPGGACVHRFRWPAGRIDTIREIGFFDDNNIVINSLSMGALYCVSRAIYAYRQTEESVYHSMSAAERAVLNVQGMDADLKMTGPEFREELTDRSAGALLVLYSLKGDIRDRLGPEKYERYLSGCRRIGDSIGEKLLQWNEIPAGDRRAVRKVIRRVSARNAGTAGYVFLNRLRNRL